MLVDLAVPRIVLLATAAAASKPSIAIDLATLALAGAVGLVIGSIRIRSMQLGVSGVLFSALLFGQLGVTIETRVLDFVRDFSLVTFMYAIGLQVGPGFGASLRAEGLRLNLLSLAVMVLGGVMALGVWPLLSRPMVPGVFVGAFNTTPGLAASQDTYRARVHGEQAGDRAASQIALGYSITYPGGVVGPMLILVALRWLFRVNVGEERNALAARADRAAARLDFYDIEVTVQDHVGKSIGTHPLLQDRQVVLTRLLRVGQVTVPTAETIIQLGDIVRALGPRDALDRLGIALGRRQECIDFDKAQGDVHRAEILVTRTNVLRHT
jgi:putative transport protein